MCDVRNNTVHSDINELSGWITFIFLFIGYILDGLGIFWMDY